MKNTKTIWLINQYGSSPDTGYAGRLFYIAKNLAEKGHTVYFVIAKSHHLLVDALVPDGDEEVQGVQIVRINTLKYSRSGSKIRVLNWFIFSLKLLFLKMTLKDKPDLIVTSSPSPFVGVAGVILSRIMGVKMVFDIRDIWPLTLTSIGNISKKNILIRLMAMAEKFALKYSSTISSNLPNVGEHVETVLGYKRPVVWLPNGIDRSELEDPEPLDASFKDSLPRHKYILGYVGSIGLANSLDTLLTASISIKDLDIGIVIVGEGDEKSELIKFKNENKLSNVYIYDRIPKIQVQSLLKEFDVCYIGWKHSELYHYGIAPNKIPEYFFSAKPVLHSYSGNLDPVVLASAGVTVPAEDPLALADKIRWMFSDVLNYSDLGENGKRYAEQNYDYSEVATKLLNDTM